jgi:hypothetical protein
MSVGVVVPATYVYLELINPSGEAVIHRYVVAHDGVRQAVAEALTRYESLEPGWRLKDVQTHNDPPRRFRIEPVVRRTLEAREF